MKNFLRELQYQIFRSWKRTIKFILVLFIPTIYAGLFILAFWNPIANIGKVPVAIMDESDRIAIVYNTNNPKNKNLKVLCDEKGNPFTENNKQLYDDAIKNKSVFLYSFTNDQGVKPTEIKGQDYDFAHPEFQSLSDILLQILTPNNKKPEAKFDRDEATKTTWSAPAINLGNKSVQFDSIHYFYGKKAKEKYTSSDFPIQIKITNQDTMRDLYFISKVLDQFDKVNLNFDQIKKDLFNIKNLIKDLIDGGLDILGTVQELMNLEILKPLDVFGTYSHNFIVGYFVENISNFKLSIFSSILKTVINNISNQSHDDTSPANILKILWPAISKKIDTAGKIINFNFEREEKYGLYGYGIGEFFICIAITIAILAQSMLYKRSPISKHSGAVSYFFTKYGLMLMTAWLQATVMCVVFAMTPFNSIGVAAMFTFWAWLLVFDMAMVAAMCFIMIAFRDDVTSKFGMTFFLLINLTAGNGTFPTYMQFSIFQWIGHITIFQPIIKGLGIIFYQISTTSGVGLTTTDSLNMVKYFFILVAIMLVAFGLGIFAASRRYKEQLYGTHSAKEVSAALIALGRVEEEKDFSKKNIFGMKNWKALFNYGDGDQELKEHVLKHYPFEKKHRWYQSKFDK
ncbi:ABC transporter permease [Spiroplasma endosymbiont of Crioceris asparagi]|uniref:ABC transporter permease n=1 Tax=Spiroplasma endosymbiont of Crioceris asparagi TaxID=3066286 RepID=UPI0030CD145E